MQSDHDVIKFCVFSLVVHIVLWLLLGLLPHESLEMLKNRVPVDVVYETPKKPDHTAKQIVHQVDVPEEAKADSEAQPRFMSEKEQRVKEETRAALIGETTTNKKNGSPMAKPQHSAAHKKPQLDLQKHLEIPGPGAKSSDASSEDSPSQPLQLNPGIGISERSEDLPDDVKVGSMTVLNSDRYLFYSFYDRLEKRVVPRWRMNVRNLLDQGRRRAPPASGWTTVIEVLLTPDGDYVRTNMMQSSQWEQLDNAPILAFRQASPIPHPPPEMVKSDGYIHILFGFSVHY